MSCHVFTTRNFKASISLQPHLSICPLSMAKDKNEHIPEKAMSHYVMEIVWKYILLHSGCQALMNRSGSQVKYLITVQTHRRRFTMLLRYTELITLIYGQLNYQLIIIYCPGILAKKR